MLRNYLKSALRSKTALTEKILDENAVETIEYIGLAGIISILIIAVAVYMQNGGGDIIVAGFRDTIDQVIAGLSRGW